MYPAFKRKYIYLINYYLENKYFKFTLYLFPPPLLVLIIPCSGSSFMPLEDLLYKLPPVDLRGREAGQ